MWSIPTQRQSENSSLVQGSGHFGGFSRRPSTGVCSAMPRLSPLVRVAPAQSPPAGAFISGVPQAPDPVPVAASKRSGLPEPPFPVPDDVREKYAGLQVRLTDLRRQCQEIAARQGPLLDFLDNETDFGRRVSPGVNAEIRANNLAFNEWNWAFRNVTAAIKDAEDQYPALTNRPAVP